MRVVKTSMVSVEAGLQPRASPAPSPEPPAPSPEPRAPDTGASENFSRAPAFSDPVPLHRQDLFRPRLKILLSGGEQFVGVLRDPEEPLLQLAHNHGGAAAPAGAVDHLLVGEHRLAARAPVDARLPLVGEVALEHLQEDPLVPAVVLGQAGGDLAFPGVADPDALELPFHVGDVLERPLLGMGAVLDRGVLRRQAKCVPAERVQHVEATHPFHARDNVADHVIADVADVRVPRRVREHFEAVELRPGGIFGDLKRA